MEIDRWICHVFIHAYAQTRTCLPWHYWKETYIYEKRRTKETYVHEEHVYRTVCCRMSVFCSHIHMMECVCCTLSCSVLQGFVVMRTCRNVSTVRCVYISVCCSVFQCVAVCFSCAHRIQECVYRTICCSVLQCVAVCCSVFELYTPYTRIRPAPQVDLPCVVCFSMCVCPPCKMKTTMCVHTRCKKQQTRVFSPYFLFAVCCCVQCVLALNLPCWQKSGGISTFIMQLTPYMNATDFVYGSWRHPWLLQKSGSSKNIIIRNWRRSSKSWEVSNSTHALRVFYKTNLIHLN